jgi:hypothetical protein
MNILRKIVHKVDFIYKIMVDNLAYVDVALFTQNDTNNSILKFDKIYVAEHSV